MAKTRIPAAIAAHTAATRIVPRRVASSLRQSPRAYLFPVSSTVLTPCLGLTFSLVDYRVRTIMHCPSELVEHFCPPLPSVSVLMYLMKCPTISALPVLGSLLQVSPGKPIT